MRRLTKGTPSMPASVIAERVGWTGSSSWFRKKIAQVKPEFAPKDPADRISYRAGDQAQCDLWFPPVDILLGDGRFGSPPVLVIVASYSRFITAVMLPSRTTPDLLAGMWSLISGQLEAVPRRFIWDNEAGIGRRNKLAEGVAAFCGALPTKIVQLKPFDPESKGIVERANQFLETSFLPGRSFTSVADFNEQLAQWLPTANSRTVRSLRARLIDRIDEDRAAMLAVPPPPSVGFSSRIRLPRDYYVRVFGNNYSVHPSAIGRMVDVHADLAQVTVRINNQVIASPERSMGLAATKIRKRHAIRYGEVPNSNPPLDLAAWCNVYREVMEITLQYFDGCPNWTIAAERLAVIAAEYPGVIVNRQLVESVEDAETIGFRGSPSILVDGRDLFPDLSATVGLACRIYATPVGFAGTPTLEQLRKAVAAA